jgi:hypothetical protein
MFWTIVLFIFIISVIMALLSLRGLNAKKELKRTSEDLKRGKVIFSKDHSSSGES